MGAGRPRTVVLDAGALIAFERNDRRIRRLIELAMLHGVLAAVGFYLWLRSLKTSPLPATLCSLSFAGSALMVNYWGFPTHLASIAWVPWIFWGTTQLTKEPGFARWGFQSPGIWLLHH